MKRLIIVIVALFIVSFSTGLMANPDDSVNVQPKEEKDKEEPKIGKYSICPSVKISGELDTCLRCHDHKMRLREVKEDEWRMYPNNMMYVIGDVGYYNLAEIKAASVKEFFDYLRKHKIKTAVFNIESWGGSLIEGWAIVGLMMEFQTDGVVKTRCQGMAISAGFLILSAGTKRLVNPNALLMWHELWSLKFLTIETPSSTERDAKTKRWLQDTANQFLAEHSKMKKEEIDDAVKDGYELWLTGAEAVKKGFADGFIK